MIRDDETVAFYDKEAATYIADMTGEKPSESFLRFATRLKPAGAVLDLGCGGGAAARRFDARGFEVTALDASASMIANLDDCNGITKICADFDALDMVDAFDAIWANFSLQHIPREDFWGVLDRVVTALRPNGWLHIGIHEGSETLRDRLGRLYCHYTEAELTEGLETRGVIVARVGRDAGNGYDGRPIISMIIEAQNNG